MNTKTGQNTTGAVKIHAFLFLFACSFNFTPVFCVILFRCCIDAMLIFKQVWNVYVYLDIFSNMDNVVFCGYSAVHIGVSKFDSQRSKSTFLFCVAISHLIWISLFSACGLCILCQCTDYGHFFSIFKPILTTLALDRYGSHVVEAIWLATDGVVEPLLLKEQIAEQLVGAHQRLRVHRYGHFLYYKLNLGMFVDNKPLWRRRILKLEKRAMDSINPGLGKSRVFRTHLVFSSNHKKKKIKYTRQTKAVNKFFVVLWLFSLALRVSEASLR